MLLMRILGLLLWGKIPHWSWKRGGISDHTEYKVPHSFMRVPERVRFPRADACRPAQRRDALIRGPCLSGASWSALLRLASVRSHEARRGVTGFGAFCRNKRASPAGAKPGNTEHHVDTRVGDTCARRSPASACLPATPKMDSRYPTSSCQARTINAE